MLVRQQRSTYDASLPGGVDNQIIAVMRLVLAVSALLIIAVDPAEPDRLVGVTYSALTCYVIYSTGLLLLARRRSPLMPRIDAWAHRIDVGWYLGLIALSSGTSSIFFFFFFFAVLTASFRFGFAEGLGVTIVSAVLFSVVGYLTAPRGAAFELNRFLLRPIYLLVLGYMMAYWGGSETTLKRRLTLLKELGTLSNPRFGVGHTIGSLMKQLRAFYSADAITLVTVDAASGEHLLHRVGDAQSIRSIRTEPFPPELQPRLLALPPELAAVYSSRPGRWPRTRYAALNARTGEHTTAGREACAVIAATLDSVSVLTVPVYQRDEQVGRLYLARRRHFHRSDLTFLLQVVAHVLPLIENTRLVDRLTTDAAEEARQHIARDLHDSVIQPYIGLQMGLGGCIRKLPAESDVRHDLEQLLELARESIASLRGYIHELREGGARLDSLVVALRRYVARFSEATGIQVRVASATDVRINEQLAGEVFQIVAEGLSNIRRHTDTREAAIELREEAGHLIVRIENAAGNGASSLAFRPRSISERAATLGGSAVVERHHNLTRVVVDIPL